MASGRLFTHKANNKIARYELGNQHWTILIDEAQDLTPRLLCRYSDAAGGKIYQ